jgi:hypothetical protein
MQTLEGQVSAGEGLEDGLISVIEDALDGATNEEGAYKVADRAEGKLIVRELR